LIFTYGRGGGYLTHLDEQEAYQMLADGTIHDGMIPKVKAALPRIWGTLPASFEKIQLP
jgi:acetylglutamate kinase